MRRTPDLRRPLLASTWRAFSPVAAVSVAAVTATGLYLAGRQLPGLSAVTGSWYGAAAAGKVVVLVAALVVATSTTLIVNPRLARAVVGRRPLSLGAPVAARFPRLIGVELALLGTAVLLASVMTSVPRPSDGPPAEALATVTVDGLFVSFESVPAGAGQSRLIVRVNAVTRPQPGPVTGADVLLVDPRQVSTSVTLTRIEPGRFEATVAEPADEHLHVWVAVHRSKAQDAVAGLAWSAAPPAAAGPTRLEPVTTLLAALGALGAVGGVVALRRRSRKAGPAPLFLTSEPDGIRERVGMVADGTTHD